MKQKTNSSVEILSFVEDFKTAFREKFGIDVRVFWNQDKIDIPEINLNQLEKAANILLQDCIFAEGIKSKTRRKEVVILRQCVFKIARESGYTLTSIGSYFDFDHATILYSVTHVNNLLKTKDRLTIETLSKLENVIQTQFRNDGDVQRDVEEGCEPE